MLLASILTWGTATADVRRRVDLPVPAANPRAAARLALGARDDLEVTSERESQTMTHVRLSQRAPDGTRVLGSETAVHLSGAAPMYTVRLAQAAPARVTMTGVRRLDTGEAAARAAVVLPGTIAAREAVSAPAGPGLVRPAVWLAVDTGSALNEVLVDADSGQVTVGADLRVPVDGSGRVYRPNPITESGILDLVDGDGGDSPELTALLETVSLRGLDGTGALRGEFADAHPQGSRLIHPDLVFELTRGQPGFDEISAYYHIDRAQRYVQSLGFTGARGIRAQPLEIVTDYTTADQSFYDPVAQKLELGTGGVDDAEDADVVVHEYGHSLEYFLVPHFGKGKDALALGEGWGDTLAATVPTLSEHAAQVDRACIGPWDASAYDPPQPCMRRVDGSGHYPEALVSPREPHADGEIWSGTLHDLFAQPDVGAEDGLRLVLESMFLYADNESFAAAGAALLAADADLYGGAHTATIRRVLIWHGILADITPAVPGGDVVASVTTALEHAGGPSLDVVETISAPGASALRVHLASFGLAASDGLYVYDKLGNLYARLSGIKSDVDAPIVPGDEVRVRLITGSGSTSTGFVIDRYDVIRPLAGPDGGVAVSDATTAPDAAQMTGSEGGGCHVAAGQAGDRRWLLAVLIGVMLAARGAPRRRR